MSQLDRPGSVFERALRASARRRFVVGAVGVSAMLATAGAAHRYTGEPADLLVTAEAEAWNTPFWPDDRLGPGMRPGGGGELLDPRTVLGYRNGRRRQIQIVTLGLADVEIGTAQAFLAMRQAAAREGIDLTIQSGFRTRADQAKLYRAYRRGRGNKAARPGRSNHQSGRALDLAIATPGTLDWLTVNATRFGFKRTVRGEPWHWEYVNSPRARKSGHRYAKSSKSKRARHARQARKSAKSRRRN